MFEFGSGFDIKEIVKTMLAMKSTSMQAISGRLKNEKNISLSQSGLSKKLSTGTIRFNEIKAIAELLGYEVIIRGKQKK
ncbi:MAG: hypothetical protein PHC64_06050 [Candidatus Gastranaerophilales bacterium]|nr:hypothetical protein [Candidatus Gastranaerophilales bacterium]